MRKTVKIKGFIRRMWGRTFGDFERVFGQFQKRLGIEKKTTK